MKKATALLLLSALFLNLFACGGKPRTDNEATSEAADQTTSEPEKTYDFKNADFHIIGENGAMDNFPSEEETGEVINDTLIERDRAVGEKLNINIKYSVMTGGQACGMLEKSVLSGDKEYDMLGDSAINISKLATNGILLDISGVKDFDYSAPGWSELVAENCQIGGKIYFLSGDILPVVYTIPGCIFMNCDSAENYKITKEDVYDVVDSGKWTIDKLISYTKNTCQDLDGSDSISSEKDFIGYLSLSGPLAAGVLAVGSGIKLCEETPDGIKVDLMNERTLKLIDKAKLLFADYAPDTNSDNLHLAFRENRMIFSQHYTSSAFTRYRDVNADFAILPMPKLDEAQDSYYSMMNPWGYAFVAFPNNADAEKVAVISGELTKYSYEKLRPVVYEEAFKLKGARDEKSADMLDLIFNNLYVDNNAIYNFGGSMSCLSDSVFNGAEFASAWASIAESAREAAIQIVENTK